MVAQSDQSSFRKEDLDMISVVSALAPYIRAFKRFAEALWQHTLHTEEQSRTLDALRDTLLPKLVSGELRAEDPEGVYERAKRD